MVIEKFKDFFYQAGSSIHLNNAGLAPITSVARDRINYWSERFFQEGFYTDLDYVNEVARSRQNLADLIGCNHSEIAFFQSTAGAVSQFALEYPLKPGDEVIMWAEEYASHLYPWQEACKRKGATLVLVKSQENLATPYELLVEKITPKTKIIAISWVQFFTGAKTDLKALSKITREKNIFLFADIIQGLGLHPFNMKEWGVDGVAGGSHKWLFSPVGVGFLAIDEKHISKIKPHNIGAYTFGTCDDPTDMVCEPKKDALKFEAGSKQVLEITALGASVDLILKTGVDNIEKETLRLATLLRSGLEAKDYIVHSPYESNNHQSSIVNFLPHPSSAQILRGLPCNFAIRGPGLRLSVAAFIKDDAIKRVVHAL